MGSFLRKAVSLSDSGHDFFYRHGKPITVFSAPFGLPFFFILGGSFTFSRPKEKVKAS